MNYLTTKQKEYSKGCILQAPSIKDGQTNGGYVVYRDNLADEDGVIDLLRDDIYYESSTGGAVLDYDKAAVKRNDLVGLGLMSQQIAHQSKK